MNECLHGVSKSNSQSYCTLLKVTIVVPTVSQNLYNEEIALGTRQLSVARGELQALCVVLLPYAAVHVVYMLIDTYVTMSITSRSVERRSL